MADRKDAIRNRLAGYLLEDQGCAVVCPSKEAVQLVPIDGHLFGWFPPMPLDDNPDLPIVSICPELIAETTEWLDNDQLDTYLVVVEALLAGYVDALRAGITPEAAREQIESGLFETNPDALALCSEVELRALDAGIVPLLS